MRLEYVCTFGEIEYGVVFWNMGEKYMKIYNDAHVNPNSVNMRNGFCGSFLQDENITVSPDDQSESYREHIRQEAEKHVTYEEYGHLRDDEYENLRDEFDYRWHQMVEQYNRKFQELQKRFFDEGKRQEEQRKNKGNEDSGMCDFASLKDGEFFEYENQLFIKVHIPVTDINAINLLNSATRIIKQDAEVKRLPNAKVVY